MSNLIVQHYGFKDLREREEYQQDGSLKSYRPQGVVVSMNYDMPEKELMDLLVSYVSPAGVVYRESRGISQVELSEVNSERWAELKMSCEIAQSV